MMDWRDKDELIEEKSIKSELFRTKMFCTTEIFNVLISFDSYEMDYKKAAKHAIETVDLFAKKYSDLSSNG